MFKRKQHEPVVTEVVNRTIIELSDESRQALVSLDNDIQTLNSFMKEVSDKASLILGALHAEVTAQVPSAEINLQPEGIGVKVFAEDGDIPPTASEMNTRIEDDQRIRDTPFTRSPRSVQITWLKSIMTPGVWYGAAAIAREHASDERHLRYMRSAVGGRFREMYEDGEVERRDSHTKGSMFEYRLKG